jgi:hypothetical protein
MVLINPGPAPKAPVLSTISVTRNSFRHICDWLDKRQAAVSFGTVTKLSEKGCRRYTASLRRGWRA